MRNSEDAAAAPPPQQQGSAPRRRGTGARLAALPVPVLLGLTLVLWRLDLPGARESARLMTGLNFVFSTLTALLIAYLVARSYLVRATPGLLMLGTGVVLWGAAGVVSMAVGYRDANVIVTIHNTCACIAAACHLVGVSASLRPRVPMRASAVCLPLAYTAALAVVGVLAVAASAGVLPVFFVQGEGGTPLRQGVLGSAIAMFALAAVLLEWTSRRNASSFPHWYGLALALVAVGLLGVLLQSSVASVLGWAGRASQLLGGVYMVVAAFAALRDAREWGIPLEDALRDSAARYRALFSRSPDGILLVARDGRIAAANAAARSLFGRSEEELRLLRPGALVDGGDPRAAHIVEDWPRVELRRAEIRLHRADGSAFEAEVSTAPLPPGDEQLVVVRDVTERRRAEAALAQANARLEEIDRRKDEFLAVLSHELRNPLAPIRYSLSVLDATAPGSEQARRAQAVIDRQVRQLTRLVDDLLDVTRVTRNKIRLQRAPVELNELVRRTVEDHRGLFDAGGVRLELASWPEPVVVDGDWQRLSQVVGNLLANAAKFTPRGGATRVAVCLNAPGRRAVLRVADSGAGLSEQTRARLFEPFMQAETTLDRTGGGLGLGLALVKGLVDLHGGEVTAHSEGLGRGSEFVVRLPLSDARAPAERVHSPLPATSSRRVLVVEDNFDGAESLRVLLEHMGHLVEIAADGAEALAKARAFRPDAIVCDIGLPGMNGYDVARAIRADPEIAGARLLALTGYALPDDVERATRAGFDGHLAKPPSPERLACALAEAPEQALAR